MLKPTPWYPRRRNKSLRRGLGGQANGGKGRTDDGLHAKLLVGAEARTWLVPGAGKTTLLKVLGGKHMVAEGAVRVLGASPFHDTTLAASGRLSYLGGNWDRDIAFAGYSIPLQVC